MDNFMSTQNDQLPTFLHSPLKKRAKLSIHQFTFKQDQKKSLLQLRKKSFSHLPIQSESKQLKELKSGIISGGNRYQSEEKFKELIMLEEGELGYKGADVHDGGLMRRGNKSEHKLPALAKCNVELNVDVGEDEIDKFIRVRRDVPKAKLNKAHGHYRQLSEKNQIVRTKQQDRPQQPQTQSNSPSKPDFSDRQQQRCYFIRNLTLNAISTLEADNKQRANLNLLVSKLKQTERRVGRQAMGLNFNEKKMETNTPVELKTNKMHYEEVSRNSVKEEIMKKFTQSILKLNAKPKEQKEAVKKKQENFVSGWAHGNNYIQEILQF